VAAGEMDQSYGYVLIIVIISFAVVALMNYFTLQKERIPGGKK
jgi:molybdate transport system permease protein